MPLRQQIPAIIVGFCVLALIIELVRRRKLREEYSWLWLVVGFIIFLLVVWRSLLVSITRLMGIIAPTSAVFFFGIIFLILVNLYSATKISELNNQVKKLAQKLAILDSDVQPILDTKTEQNAKEQEIGDERHDNSQ